jgi:hypothetical protein
MREDYPLVGLRPKTSLQRGVNENSSTALESRLEYPS